jgi:serine/threonine protein kinase
VPNASEPLLPARPPTNVGAPSDPDGLPGERTGDRIARYTLVEVLGEGGFGTVWRAEQHEPVRRDVALKILKLGMDTRQVVQRFEAERQALALMDHPNIAKVFDGGATASGRPYFVMELVRGEPITSHCDAHGLDVPARLRLFLAVCHALQHAHTKGVVHRDIKPANVLVASGSDGPLVKVIDFGIAKATSAELTEDSLRTEFDQVIGTPEYMAPEQVSFGAVDIDTRADVYSLGVVLYELLTRTKPFDLRTVLVKGYDELLRTIREVVPAKPSTRVTTRSGPVQQIDAPTQRALGERLRGDLDWVVLKALEKDRERRYQSAAALATDIEAHLEHRPVAARPPSRRYLATKFVRRHRVEVAIAGALLGALVLGVFGTSAALAFALAERDRADAARQAAESASQLELAARRTAESELARATEIERIVTGMLASIRPELAQGRDTTLLRLILEDTSRALLAGEIADPAVAAKLDRLVGTAYHGLGVADRARPHLERAQAHYRALVDAPKAEAPSLDEAIGVERALAALTQFEGRVLEAVAAFERVLELARAGYGPASPQTLTILVDVAQAHLLARDAERALALLDEFEAARATVADLDPFVVRTAAARRGAALLGLDRHDEARVQLEQLVEAVERDVGPHDPVLLTALGTLVSTQAALGRRARASALARERLERCETALGERHPLTLDALNGLGLVQLQLGREEDAVATFERLLRIGDQELGPDHTDQLEARMHLALAHGVLRRFDAAFPLADEAVDGLRARFGDSHPRTLEALRVRLAVARDSGDDERRLRHLEQYVAALVAARGPADPDTFAERRELAALLSQRGDAERACVLLDELAAAQRAHAGPRAPQTLEFLNELATVHFVAGRMEAARALYAEIQPVAEAELGAQDRFTLGVTTNLGLAELELGHLEVAEPLLSRSFEDKLRLLGASDPWTRSAYIGLHDVLRSSGRSDEARALTERWRAAGGE